MPTESLWVRRTWAERVERAWLSATHGQHSGRPIYSDPRRPVSDGLKNFWRGVRQVYYLCRLLYTSGQGMKMPRQTANPAGAIEIKG